MMLLRINCLLQKKQIVRYWRGLYRGVRFLVGVTLIIIIGLTFTFGLKMCSFNLSLALIAYIGRGHNFSYFPGVPFYNFSRRGLKR